ncbi:hypothetical protein GF327_03595 [Candidatus Woesearchaeota archaeon]|nr:hypothetical protein [Candidatus Woesearchaeota archaeon]
MEEKKDLIENFDEAKAKFAHLSKYAADIAKLEGEPRYLVELDRSMKSMEDVNLIYPVGGPIFIHILKKKGKGTKYHAIEPFMDEKEKELFDEILDKLIEIANHHPVPPDFKQIDKVFIQLFNDVVVIGEKKKSLIKQIDNRIYLDKAQYEKMKYFILRNRLGYGKLEPLLNDPYLEDIHCTGVGHIMTVHKIFEMVHTNIIFKDDLTLNKYIVEITERVERPASDAHSIVDAMMPDGSRANFIYGRDISLEGSSFTLRKFSEVPISITQIVNWGTMSSEVAAYLWIALENGMNVFVCGETASGKTTTLNAISAFIKPDDKVYTVENTPEVTMPHACWQHLLTREAGKSSDVSYEDLLIASLRSRPNYILVGEIRGVEGSIAFQAMQTGHPVMSTFHAGNVTTMIQRITGDPINVPITFVDNLNIALIQMAVFHEGHFLRRVLSVTELERYYQPAKKMVTREVFEWNPVKDKHNFKGLFNSYILENKIAKILGYEDTRKIYDEMEIRRKIIDKMIEEKIFNYYDVWEIIKNFHRGGKKTLPFNI